MKREKTSSIHQNIIGRPRNFDETVALKSAMHAFWRYGYESTSMAVLSKKMGMSPPSIYASFGNKETLFLKALELYVGDLRELRIFVGATGTAHEALARVFEASILRFTGSGLPRGCLLASAVAGCSAEAAGVQKVVAEKRRMIEKIFRTRIEKDIVSGRLPTGTSARTVAALTMTVIQGMSILARDGASRKKLRAIAKATLDGWRSNDAPHSTNDLVPG